MHTRAHTHRCTHTQMRAHTHTHTHRRSCTCTHTHARTHTRIIPKNGWVWLGLLRVTGRQLVWIQQMKHEFIFFYLIFDFNALLPLALSLCTPPPPPSFSKPHSVFLLLTLNAHFTSSQPKTVCFSLSLSHRQTEFVCDNVQYRHGNDET